MAADGAGRDRVDRRAAAAAGPPAALGSHAPPDRAGIRQPGIAFEATAETMSSGGRDRLVPVRDITPAQVREARQLLGWKQSDLAVAASVAVTTVMRIEGGISALRRNVQAVSTALVKAGIVIDELGHLARCAMPRAERAGMLSARAATALPCLTADQVLEARRLLGWKQATLAAEASVSVGTLVKIEAGFTVRPATLLAVVTVLSDAGVVVATDGQVRRGARP